MLLRTGPQTRVDARLCAVVVHSPGLRHASLLEIRVRHPETLADTVHPTLVRPRRWQRLLGAGLTSEPRNANARPICTRPIAGAPTGAASNGAVVSGPARGAHARSIGRLAMLAHGLVTV